MSRIFSRGRSLGWLVALLGFGSVSFWQIAADEPAGEAAKPETKAPAVRATAEMLGGKDRFLTHVSTDKPFYRIGETVYVRGVLLHHATHQPLPAGTALNAVVEIFGPKGDVVASGYAPLEDSVLGFQWPVPAEQAGGQYKIRVSYPNEGYAPAERRFDIRAYRAPRLKSQIRFLRDGYGPGDTVAATLEVTRAEGGVPEGAAVTVTARVDGEEVHRGEVKVDANGRCVAKFKLPAKIARGDGTLSMAIADGGVIETAGKTIPILLQTVDLTLYPEGGDLVARLKNRVYFEARTPAKKPADIAGIVVDSAGREVAKFRSEHEGRGRFSFTPAAGQSYSLKIEKPSGITTTFPLPEVHVAGAVLQAAKDVFHAGEPIKLRVAATGERPLVVTLSQRETVLATANIAAIPSAHVASVSLKPAAAVEGVLIATVSDADGKPLAERLVFRRPVKSVQLKITADRESGDAEETYTPGGKVKLNVTTTDETGRAIEAVVGVTVTDDSVLEMVEKREQAPRLPVMVLLGSDVLELADAHVYLDPQNDKAPLAVDLLLGTQGWRRFAVVNVAEFLTKHEDAAKRALAVRIPMLEVLSLEERFKFDGGFPAALGGPQKSAPAPANESRELQDQSAVRDLENRAAEIAALLQPQASSAVAAEADAGKPAEALGGLAAGAPGANPFLDRRELASALREQAMRRRDFIAVRVYAHQVRETRQPGERSDFTETLFWHAGLKTDKDGKASIEFGLNDAVSSFRVMADAFSAAGGLGQADHLVKSVEPFYLEPKLPLAVTQGDRILLPIGLVNATNSPLDGDLRIQVPDSLKVETAESTFALPKHGRVRKLLSIDVGSYRGDVEVLAQATTKPGYGDNVTRKLRIDPLGFPHQDGRGGLVGPGEVATQEITIPDDLVARSLTGRVVVYPTPLASMNEALAALIQEPCGCFEQTSSTVYPLVMAQQYFMSHQGVDPSLIERSAAILETGYNRLLGFECKSGGFEWFGQDPGHDALTAYGLMEFHDMEQVRYVDPTLLDRTRKWLLGQRDGQGGFRRDQHTYHTWLADPEIAFSYNTWALLEAKAAGDLKAEVAYVRRAAEATQNTYVMALGANVLSLARDKEGENHLLDKLAGKQIEDGSLKDAVTSVVGSGGDALQIETTALATMAWLRNPAYAAQVEKAIHFLAENCKAGRFGSTQSTILALKAIVAYDAARAKPNAAGSVELVIDGQPIGEPIAFTADTSGAIELPDASAALTPGKHTLQVKMTDGSVMPYTFAVKYHRLKPASAADCKLHLQVSLKNDRLDEGTATEAQVVVINRTGETIPTPMVIVGIPGGLEVRHDQLKELVKAGRIAAYEVLGREVVLYWRAMTAEQRIELPISLTAAIPGTYTGPASRAYLYYTDELKQWADGLKVEISPKATE